MSVINSGERLASKVAQEPLTPELRELFHENTKLNKYRLKVLLYNMNKQVSDLNFKSASLNSCKAYPTSSKIKLKKTKDSNIKLIDAIHKRRSQRNFLAKEVKLADLSSILIESAGINGKVSVNEKEVLVRAYPSGGALYPLELYVVANNVSGLEKGIYHYNVKDNSLEKLELFKKGDFSKKYEISDQFINDAPVTILVSAMFHRTTYKYGNRGYRFILMEVGHMLQNISLLSVANGLGSCEVGGYEDDELNNLLKIDGITEAVVGEIALGYTNEN